jgi:hypothetical protein
VTATFTPIQYMLTVTKSGTGSGTVTSTPAGIDCGSDCTGQYDQGTEVVLTASPDTGSTFGGWSGGGCGGIDTCVVSMTAAQSVTAGFTLNQYTLTVVKDGTGTGTVTSSPAGIDCGTVCSEAYDYDTEVTLTANPDAGSTFGGWSGGGCGGTDTCVVSMTAAQSVTAGFTLNQYELTVTKDGTGHGTVASTPAGINCGSVCSQSFDYGTTVTLTAFASTGSGFSGWSGSGCSGTGSCDVTMTAARSVNATFDISCIPETHIYAGQSVSINQLDGFKWIGDSVRAVEEPAVFDSTGWVGFNIDSLPDTLQITDMTLYLYHESIAGSPSVRVWYSTGNNFTWIDASTSTLPRTQVVSGIYTSLISNWNAFTINVGARDWSTDLADNWITLGVDNVNNSGLNYINFYGASNAMRPYLVINGCL